MAALLAGAFILDSALSMSLAVGVLYVLAIWRAAARGTAKHVLAIAAACTIISVLAWSCHLVRMNGWGLPSDRLVSLAVIWAAIAVPRRHSPQRLVQYPDQATEQHTTTTVHEPPLSGADSGFTLSEDWRHDANEIESFPTSPLDATVDGALRELSSLQILPASALAPYREEALSAPASLHELAARLHQAGLLTAYQEAYVRQGCVSRLRLGNYVVLDRLGSGGMSTVLLARHIEQGTQAALKTLSRSAPHDGYSSKRFRRERRVLRRLSHPNIVRAHEEFEHEGRIVLALERLRGPSLQSLVRRHGPLPIPQALESLLQAAHALEYAHARGIVHRDVKPSNLLLAQENVIKLIDFGLIQVAPDSPYASTGSAAAGDHRSFLGSIDFVAPEQALNPARATAKSDVFSLGATLFFLLTGLSHLDGAPGEKLQKLINEPPWPATPLEAHRDDAPLCVRRLYLAMVEKPPARRPESAEVVARLQECLKSL